jgi:hypothetical protein
MRSFAHQHKPIGDLWGGLSAMLVALPSAIAFGVTVTTPWTVVVGSLAYNETPMLLLAAGALIVAIDPGLSAWRKGLLAGILIGAACGVKPTALLMLARCMLDFVTRHSDNKTRFQRKKVLRQKNKPYSRAPASSNTAACSKWERTKLCIGYYRITRGIRLLSFFNGF